MKSVDYDANKYGTKIYKLAANSNYLQEVKATDYFSHSSMQALNCEVKKLLQDETRESKRYVKIVNSWSSINDNIREIKYYSGVSVSIGECIQVTEIKCMAELLGGQGLVQFKCDFGTGRPANRPIIVPNPVYIDETTREYFPNGNERREYELHLPGDQSSREWEGKRIMRIGKSSKELGLSTEKLK
ncbi:uncharacterized protein LOC120354194 isoform X2 [Nilaparvata lugens]|uniref:uncharacterized protein LOC120354194 isoform X2 n=1 Tax=Nilaparvata lugens TaxID=108931 RepID=UPI00193E8C27|nr:uncharacterized protein LOC120354194 isoform X2 [Nilaparvata lugens]